MNGIVKMSDSNGYGETFYEFRNGVLDERGLMADFRVIGKGEETKFCGMGHFSWKDKNILKDWYILELRLFY